MKKFFVTVLSISIFVIAVYGVNYAMTPVNTQKIEYITHETSINTNGFIILEEWMATSRSTATSYFFVSEGARVAKDSAIGELFYGEVSQSSIKELNAVDNRIEVARRQSETGMDADFDSSTVENNIYRRENNIIEAAAKNDVSAITQYKRDINNLRANNSLSYARELEELKSQRNNIINNMGMMKEEIIAEISGAFTTYTDGFENRLEFSKLDTYNLAYFNSLPQSVKTEKLSSRINAGGDVCKIVNNHVFYVMMAVPSDVMEGRSVGDSVTLRLNNMASAMAGGLIYRIGEDENGKRLVTVRCPEYIENAYKSRAVDVDLIFESYTGYRIPVHAIRTEEDGKHKVIGIHEGRQYDCYVDVLYTNTDGGYTIARASDGSTNKLSQIDRILVGER